MDNDTFTTGDLIEALTNERDTALKEVERLKAELQQIKTVTWCAYCGAEFPLDTVTSEQIEEHIGVCPKHPMRIPEAEAKALREVIKDYLEWGAMTGSDRDLFEDKFKAALAHGGEDHCGDESCAECKGGTK